jgi:hypothetical protein
MNPHIPKNLGDSTGNSLRAAAAVALGAAIACRAWEDGGDPRPVAETAGHASQAAKVALEAVIADEAWDTEVDDPGTRRARLAYAGWLLVLAGTDEHGQSSDLEAAAKFLHSAADF